MSVGYPADYPGDTACHKYLDDDQFIAFRFQDDGYVTMMNEDWSMGVFNWPGCKGFAKKPVDHYMRPFQLRIDGGRWRALDLRPAVHRNSCHENYYYQMEYLKDFLKTYPDKPKFSLTWMSSIAHDDANALYHVDDYFYQFFKEYKEKLANSYIIVMGDHGNRFSGIRYTPVGEVEDNNPLLFFSVPEKVRENGDLMVQLKKNTKDLITHFDIYATLVDIVKVSFLEYFIYLFIIIIQPENPRIPNPLVRGSSLFKPLPQPRTCDSLRVPFEYCSCKTNKTRLPKDNEIAVPAANIMIKEMNKVLKEDPDTKDKCAELRLSDAKILVDRFEEKSKIKLYKVFYYTEPGGGRFWGYMTQDPADGDRLRILSERFPRMNSYGKQAKCAITAKYAAYCYCNDYKEEGEDTSTTTAAPEPAKVKAKVVPTAKPKDVVKKASKSTTLLKP